MSAPEVLTLTANVRCECGKVHQFMRLEDTWQHVWECACGRAVSVQVPIFEVEYAEVAR